MHLTLYRVMFTQNKTLLKQTTQNWNTPKHDIAKDPLQENNLPNGPDLDDGSIKFYFVSEDLYQNTQLNYKLQS